MTKLSKVHHGTHTGCRNVFALRTDTGACRILSPDSSIYSIRDRRLLLPSEKRWSKKRKAAFEAVDRSTEEGRKQVGRIRGATPSPPNAGAAPETLAENLSDGVIAPIVLKPSCSDFPAR